jgi:hypothetical protein
MKPDLQKLIEQFGSYSKITAEAWARWDADAEAYRARITAPPPAPIGQPRLVSSRLYPASEECCCCYARGIFGYSIKSLTDIGRADLAEPDEVMTWFCDQHRPGKYFADARR